MTFSEKDGWSGRGDAARTRVGRHGSGRCVGVTPNDGRRGSCVGVTPNDGSQRSGNCDGARPSYERQPRHRRPPEPESVVAQHASETWVQRECGFCGRHFHSYGQFLNHKCFDELQ